MLTKYFTATELLPPGFDDVSVLHPKLLQLIDEVRELLNVKCVINNYNNGGPRRCSGYRTPSCTQGSPGSFHRKGMAVDMLPQGMTAEAARKLIKKALAEGKLANLGAVENGVSWLHIDCRPRVNGKVLWFNKASK